MRTWYSSIPHRTCEMRGTTGYFSAQLPGPPCATGRPYANQARCHFKCSPALLSRPAHSPSLGAALDFRCFTAALDRETVPAEAPQEVFVNRETLPAPAPGVLQHNATIFVEEHRIRAYEVGADQKTTISTIANLLQVHTCSPVEDNQCCGNLIIAKCLNCRRWLATTV